MRLHFGEGFFVFAIALVVFALCLNGIWATDHSTTFVQLDYSLWTNHTLVLGSASSFHPNSVDDFVYNGQFYSALAPGTPFLAVPFLGLGFTLAGGFTLYGPVLLLSELFVAIAGAVASYLTYKIARFFFRGSTSVFLGLTFAFSTIAWPFATYFFQSDVSAMFVLLAAYFALKVGRSQGANALPYSLCGLAVAAAFTVDYVNGVLLSILLGFFIVAKRHNRPTIGRAVAAFVPSALIGFALIGLYDYLAFGNPLVTSEQAYLGGSSTLGAFTNLVYLGVALNLFTPLRGLFFYSPIAVLGVMGYLDAFGARNLRTEFLLFFAIFLGVLLPYSAWYNPIGGLSFGPRFLVAAIPFMLLPAGLIIEQIGGRLIVGVYALFLIGAIMNGMASMVTAIPPELIPNASPFLDNILPNFLSGRLDTFWVGPSGQYWLPAATAVLAVACVTPIIWTHLARSHETEKVAPTAAGVHGNAS